MPSKEHAFGRRQELDHKEHDFTRTKPCNFKCASFWLVKPPLQTTEIPGRRRTDEEEDLLALAAGCLEAGAQAAPQTATRDRTHSDSCACVVVDMDTDVPLRMPNTGSV